MVKIKEDYMMSASEKTEYDRVNALPRKASGRVDSIINPNPNTRPVFICMYTPKYGATATGGKLFALEEICTRYPDYTEAMLIVDLVIKRVKSERKNLNPFWTCAVASWKN